MTQPLTVTVTNRQRKLRIQKKLLATIARQAIKLSELDRQLQPGDDIAVHLVPPGTITEINEQYLGHRGPTDVITFDYTDDPGFDAERTAAELFICPEVALNRVRDPAVATLESVGEEVVLYLVHGILHLCSLDDQTAADARAMRQAETRVCRRLAAAFDLDAVATPRSTGNET